MKLIIDIPEEVLNSFKTSKGKFICENGHDLIQGIKNGTPLDTVKAEIYEKMADYVARGYADSAEDFKEYSRIVNQTFDNIGNAESED